MQTFLRHTHRLVGFFLGWLLVVPALAQPTGCQPAYLTNAAATSGGLTGEYYKGSFRDASSNRVSGDAVTGIPFFQRLPDLRRLDGTVNKMVGTLTGTFTSFSATPPAASDTYFSARWRGSIFLVAGTYTFQTRSDDGSYLWVGPDALGAGPSTALAATNTAAVNGTNGSLFINNDGAHGARSVTGTFIAAADGLFDIQLLFEQGGGGAECTLSYARTTNTVANPSFTNVVIPASALCPGPATANATPVAVAATNATLSNQAPATTLSPGLSATDADGSGTLAYYNIVAIPTVAQGILALGGTAVVAGQVITLAQAATLTFDPAATFTGSATFTYVVTDNAGRTSSSAAYATLAGAAGTTYSIPVMAIPTAVPDAAATSSGTAVTFSLTANDTFTSPATSINGSTIDLVPGGTQDNTLTVAGVGTFTTVGKPAGSVLFTPTGSFVGMATASYTVQDNQGLTSNPATLTITVSATSQPSFLDNSTNSNGLTAEYYAGDISNLATGTVSAFVARVPGQRQVDATVNYLSGSFPVAASIAPLSGGIPQNFSARYRGSVYLKAGTYTFTVNSDDATYLFVGPDALSATPTFLATTAPSAGAVPGSANSATSLFINNGGGHGARDGSGTFVAASDGLYDLQLLYGQGGGGANASLFYQGGPDALPRTIIPAYALCSGPATADATPVATAATNAGILSSAAATTLSPGLSGTDSDGTIVFYNVISLPTGGVLALAGTAVVVGQALTPVQAATLTFDPSGSVTGNVTFQFSTTDNQGRTSNASAYSGSGSASGVLYTIPILNSPPVVANTTNVTVLNSGGTVTLNPGLSATDADGSVVSFTVNGPVSSGTLFYQGNPVTGTLNIPAANIGQLTYQPSSVFTGNATFTFRATDNLGQVSSTATYTIPVALAADLATAVRGVTGPSGTQIFTSPQGGLTFIEATTTNNGPGAATNVTLSIQLPANLTGVSLSNSGVYNTGTGLATFPNTGNLAAGASVSRNIAFSMLGTTVNASATATTNTVDQTPGNNTGTTFINPTQVADIVVAISGPTRVLTNQAVLYTVIPTNLGPSTAVGVTLSAVLPANLSNVIVSNGGVYNSTTGLVTWGTIPTLVNGASVGYTVRFNGPTSPSTILNSGGAVSAVASATSTTADGDPVTGNNNGTNGAAKITTVVVAQAATLLCIAPSTTDVSLANGNFNTYYPGLGTVAAGASSLTVGPVATAGSGTPLAVGDLVMIMQMQGGDLDITNTSAYGDGLGGDVVGSGTLLNTNFTAGTYEYSVVTGYSAATGLVNLTQPLGFAFSNADATTSSGQRRYQVIRVPLYHNVDLTANLTAPRWDGRTGGVMVLDISGTLNFNSFKMDMAGRGFRGGAGQVLGGAGGLLNSDYRTTANINTNANKGEGTAGTPRYLYDEDYFQAYKAGGTGAPTNAVLDTRTTNALRTALLAGTLADGYPSGDRARGAPGNAGGGGTDGNPGANDQNTGGGGGSNAGRGGVGGNAWDSNFASGGFGGSDFTQATASRFIMGGGGGGGTTNNATVAPVGTYPGNAGVAADGFASSGAAGGGLVLIRAANVGASAGTIDVSGASMLFVPQNDGSGGAGAGGAALVLCGASNGNASNTVLQNLTILAKGGNGGSNTGGGSPHGPGGGGAGGVAFVSSSVNATSDLTPGGNGTTFGFVQYGSGVGAAALGQLQVGITRGDLPNVVGACAADVETTISSSATSQAPGNTVVLTVTTLNNGPGVAENVTQSVLISPNLPLSSVQINGQAPSGTSGTVATYPGGATYNSATGLVTFPVVATLAAGSLPSTNVLSNTITFVMPNQTVQALATSTSTGDLDPRLANNDGSLPPASVVIIATNALAGKIFDDVNYGGGAGRNYATANASAAASGFTSGVIGSSGTRVELYTAAGAFVGSTMSGSDGSYGFAAVPIGNYQVRGVNSTVKSVRNTAAVGVLPVQTFRRTTVGSTLTDDVNRVGGESPTLTDGIANTGTGSVTLTFTGLNTSNADVAAFLDQVEIVDLVTGIVAASGGPANASFEAPVLAANSVQFNPAGGTWTFQAQAGLNGSGIANGMGYGSPTAPQGVQVGVLQGSGTISQTFSLPVGTYSVRFRTAQRNNTTADQTVSVSVNGGPSLGDVTPVNNNLFVSYTTSTFSVGGFALNTITAQSVAAVTVGATLVTAVDFGFNFDAVVNTNDTGQGTLRQFITNSNALTNGLMNQDANTNTGSDPAAGIETSHFMISNGAAHPGLLAFDGSATGGPANQLSGNGVAIITPASALPSVTDKKTTIDGTTQTLNIANSNNTTLGAGGTVGVGADGIIGTADDVVFPTLNGPEVQLTGIQSQTGSDVGLSLENTDEVVRGLSIYGFGNTGGAGTGNLSGANIRVTAAALSGTLITGNVIGSAATAFADPGTAARSTGHGIWLTGFSTGTVSAQLTNNLIAYNGASGIENLASATPTSVNVQNNEVRSNAQLALAADGIRLGGAGGQVMNNLVINNLGSGIDLAGTNGAVTVTGNTIQSNGAGGTETAGLRAFGQGNTVTLNILRNNTGDGLLVRPGTNTTNVAGSTTITRNAVFNNGQLGINLLALGDNESTGAPASGSNRVTINDLNDNDGRTDNASAIGGNGLLNFPVLQSAGVSGTNLVLSGFARPGTRIELFNTALTSPATTADASSFGEGPLYLGTVTEGGAIGGVNNNLAADTNVGTGTYGPGAVNSILQGTDNTNRFTFTIPLASLSGVGLGSVLTATATLVSGGITSEYSGVVTVLQPADVTTQIAGPATIGAGQASGTFTASFTNVGVSPAASVTQAVTLPAGASLTVAQQNAITTAYSGTTFATVGSGTSAVTTITFPTATSLAVGASNVFTYAFTAPTTLGTATLSSNVTTTTNQGDNIAPDSFTFNTTVTPVANATATIVPLAASVAAGSPARFDITFNNLAGLSPASGVTATVQLPLGVSNVQVEGLTGTVGTSGIVTFAAASGAVTYNPTTGLLTYTGITSLISGQSVASYLTYTQPITAPSVTAVASISTSTSQGLNGTADDTQAATILTTAVNTLSVALAGPATATQGGQSTYTVTTTNIGASTQSAAGTVVNIGPGRSNVFVSGGGTYNSTTGDVTFAAVSLVGGASLTRSISFTQPTSGASLTLTGTTNPAGNTATFTTTLVAPAGTSSANLQVLVSGPATVAPGGSVTYTVQQANNGPATATGVATTLSLQPGLTGLQVNSAAPTSTTGTVSAYPGGSTYDSATGLVTFPAISSQPVTGASPVTNTVTFTAPTSGVVTGTAAVTGTTPDPVLGDNQAQVQTTINAPNTGTDLACAISCPATAAAGQRVAYTVTMTNLGGAPATSAVQTVQLPAGLSLALTGPATVQVNGLSPTSATSTTATYADGSTYNASTGILTLPTSTTLVPGAGVSAQVSFILPQQGSGATASTLAVPTTVRSATNDPVLANNAARALTIVQPLADVAVTLTGPATAVQGSPVVYFVTTASNGVAVAGTVNTTVQLPAGISPLNVVVRNASGTAISGAYDSSTGVVTFPTISNLQPGAANAVAGSISFLAPSGVFVMLPTAQSAVSGTAVDINLTNNVSTVPTILTAPATTTAPDVQVLLTSNVTTQTTGLPIIFTVTTRNNTGGTPAPNVTTILQLAPGLSGVTVGGATLTSTSGTVSTYSDFSTYNSATGVMTFPAIASLSSTANVVRTITVNAPGSGPLYATATTSGATGSAATTDPLASNNSIAVSVAITSSADVAVTLAGPATSAAGAPVTYTAVTINNGPSPAAAVAPRATIPTGLALTGTNAVRVNGQLPGSSTATVATYPDGSTYTSSTGIVAFPTQTSLVVGQPLTNTVTFLAPTTTFSVVADASSTTVDPVAGNSSATQPTTVPAANIAPVAQSIVNNLQEPEGSTAAAPLPILPLVGTDADGTIVNYIVAALPLTTQGVLYVWNGTANVPLNTTNFPGLELTPTQASNLRFDPAGSFIGNVFFNYTTTDNLGAVSAAALYTIPVGLDNNSFYAATPPKGGTPNQYQNNDVLAYLIDPNGAHYNGSGLIYNATTGAALIGTANGLPTSGTNALLASSGSGLVSNPTNVLPPGTALNSITGLIYVSDRSMLPRVTVATTYSVNVVTTDVFGGTNVTTATFVLGAYPLPVELTVFAVKAVQNRDAALTWTTASEKNNDHFDVERSFDGQTFVNIGQVAGQGSKVTATNYALTDRNVAPKATGLVYYRLWQVDADGTGNYSPVRTVVFTPAVTPTAASLSLYPNPAVMSTTLDLTALPVGQRYEVELTDMSGRLVARYQLEGGQTHPLDLTSLASGSYLVRVAGADAQGTARQFVKRLTKE